MSDYQKIWTFEQMYKKVQEDCDLDEEDPEEQFVSFDEVVGYFNEAIDEAESEIMGLNQDYFLAYDYLPLVTGQSEFDMPRNIFADKLRGMVYRNGSTIYPVKKFRKLSKFENIAFAEEYSAGEDYRYYLLNGGPGRRKMVLLPPARETAVLAPLAPVFTPLKRWYIRNANRIPYLDEYTNQIDILPTAVDLGTYGITVAPIFPYVTGDKVKLSVATGSALPAPLVAGTIYYIIRVSDTVVKLAATLADARAGTTLVLTDAGTGFFTMAVAATKAIVNATLIDIPEFSTFIMEWVKANCLFKDGDPRLKGSVAKLEQQRKQMIDTLTEREPDDENEIEADFSFYNELS